MLPYVLEQYLKKTLSQSSSLTMVLYAYYTIERWYQENYTANMWKCTERSKEFFPEAIARNEEEGNGPFVPLQSCKVKIMRDKILNTLKLSMYESQDEN